MSVACHGGERYTGAGERGEEVELADDCVVGMADDSPPLNLTAVFRETLLLLQAV